VKARVTCGACGHTQELHDEPSELSTLRCQRCDASADARASEDFASAVEDALAQLWHLSKTFQVDLELSTAHIPAAFRPEPTKS
jgi:hypothetical protein